MIILLVQCVIGCLLFTLILLSAAKNPVKYLSMYPYGVQKAVRELPQYQNLPSAKNSSIGSTIIQGLLFVIIGILICLLAKIDTFVGTFIHMYIFFLVINIYDLIVIDWLLFCQKKKFRIAGTEHLDKEYRDYFYHFKVFLRGIVFGLVISFVVAAIIYLFKLI